MEGHQERKVLGRGRGRGKTTDVLNIPTAVRVAECVAEFQILDQTADALNGGTETITKDETDTTTTATTTAAEKPKFCRVTITSPVVSEKTKIENRSKRFGDCLGNPTTDESDEKKVENRSKHFGDSLGTTTDESDKKKARLGRFSSMGMGKGDAVTDDDVEKIKKRAERFGAVSSVLTSSAGAAGGVSKKDSRKERFADPAVKKRQERFGAITTTATATTNDDMDARKQSRLAKFGAVV